MPAAITHKIFADKVLEEINNNFNIIVDKEAFYYGAQGPDFFFTHRFMPWQKGEKISRFGGLLHGTEPNILLGKMREYVSKSNSKSIASYMLGFICHYSLDSVCHPYINYIADEQLADEPKQTHSIFHCESEAALDAIVYRSVYEDLASKVKIGDYFNIRKDLKIEIMELYVFLLKELFDEDVSLEMLIQVADDAQYVYSWLFDKNGFKKFLLNIIEGSGKRSLSSHLVPDTENYLFDYSNISKSEWKDMHGDIRTESFFELIESAKSKATNIISRIGSSKIDEISDNESF